MVKRFISFLYEKIEGLHQAAYVIAAFTFLSQILGLVRDRILAGMFGAGPELDIYYAAFRIPDLMFASIASLVSLFVLIPFLSERMTDDNPRPAREFLSGVTTAFLLFICLVSAVLWFMTPFLSAKLYPGIIGEGRETLIMLTRVLLISPILLGFSNILASVTQLVRRFYVYALSPIVYNLGIILGVTVLYPRFGMKGIAFGVILGSILHGVVQIPAVVREGLMPRLKFHIPWEELKSLVAVSVPRTLTLALNQGALLMLVGLASLMEKGSITIFNFASNLQLAPLSIIGVSYSVAAFPTLARLFSNGDKEAFIGHMLTAIRHVLFWSFPAITLIIVLRAHIVRTLLGSGAFDWSDTRLTAAALALFVISLVAHSLMLLFVRGYYASGKTQRPLIVNAIASTLIVVLGYTFVHLFSVNELFRYFIESLLRVENVPGTSVLMLPLAYALGMIVNASIFWMLFRKDFGGHLPSYLYQTLWQSFSAAIIAGFVAYMVLYTLGSVVSLETVSRVFVQALAAGLAGILAHILVLRVLKNKELVEIGKALHGKFNKTTAVVPETQEL